MSDLTDERLASLAAAARVLPDEYIKHEGDCSGTLCSGCGHCCHDLGPCDHDCDNRGGGCRDAIETAEVGFRRDVVALVEEVERLRGAVARVEAECRWLASGPTAGRDHMTWEAASVRFTDVLEGRR